MKKLKMISVLALILSTNAFAQDKIVSKEGSINFFSHTVAEDISSNNFSLTSTLDRKNGDVVFVVPMQGFEFEIVLMQKHFNSSKFLDTKAFPKGKFVGKITNLSDINFDIDGIYAATVVGIMTIHGIEKEKEASGTITVKGSTVTVDSKFQVTLADHEIAFENGKPSTNVAKTVDVTVKSVFK